MKRFLIFILLLLLLPKPLLAHTPAVSERVSCSFPLSITFELKGYFDEAKLLYKVDEDTSIPITSVAFPEVEKDALTRAFWKWDMRKTGGLPPGTRIFYRWVIDGEETEWREIVFEDRRKNWRKLEGENIELFWYMGDMDFAKRLLYVGERAIEELSENMDVDIGKVRVYVYGSGAELRSALIFPKEWTGGMAFPSFGTIVLGISPLRLGWGIRALRHEIGHLFLHRIADIPISSIPKWLDEGFAMSCEGEDGWWNILTEGVKKGKLFSLKSLSGNFPEDPWEASLSYAESLYFYKFLVDKWGYSELYRFISLLREGITQEEAFLEVYGMDMDEIFTEWLSSLGFYESDEESLQGCYIGEGGYNYHSYL